MAHAALGAGIFLLTNKVSDLVAQLGAQSTLAKWAGAIAPPLLVGAVGIKFFPYAAASIGAGAGASLVNSLLVYPPGATVSGLGALLAQNRFIRHHRFIPAYAD